MTRGNEKMRHVFSAKSPKDFPHDVIDHRVAFLFGGSPNHVAQEKLKFLDDVLAKLKGSGEFTEIQRKKIIEALERNAKIMLDNVDEYTADLNRYLISSLSGETDSATLDLSALIRKTGCVESASDFKTRTLEPFLDSNASLRSLFTPEEWNAFKKLVRDVPASTDKVRDVNVVENRIRDAWQRLLWIYPGP